MGDIIVIPGGLVRLLNAPAPGTAVSAN